MPMAHRPGVRSVCLTALRRRRGLYIEDLARRSGRQPNFLSRLETKDEPSWELLVELAVGSMGYEVEDVECLLHGLERGTEPAPLPASPIEVTEEELRAIRRAAGPVGRAATASQEDLLIRELRAQKVRQARSMAEKLCRTLLRSRLPVRRLFIETAIEYQNWAVAEQLAHLSLEAARRSAALPLEIARLAEMVADLVPGDEKWRARLRGYCLAFVANGWRIRGELDKADRTFRQAVEFWGKGEGGDPDQVLSGWRLPDLEASLRRDQRRFVEALELHGRARAKAPQQDLGRILLNRASTLDQMFEAEGALEVLREAEPLIEEARDPWLSEGFGFLMCVNLCHLGKYREAEGWLKVTWPPDPGKERDLIKVEWLHGKVAAGQGRIVPALESMGVVRRYFEDKKVAYDYALASLEEATIRFGVGDYARVQEMVSRDMAWVFRDVGIHREAMAALTLFRQAVESESATGTLARRVLDYLVRAQRNPDLRFEDKC